MSAGKEGKNPMELMTPEYRMLVQAAAKAKREAHIAYATEHLRREFADTQHWKSLAAKYGVRLPAWYMPGIELKYIRRACRRLGLGSEGMREATGFSRAEDFAAANPTWPAFALVGLLLEHKDSLLLPAIDHFPAESSAETGQ